MVKLRSAILTAWSANGLQEQLNELLAKMHLDGCWIFGDPQYYVTQAGSEQFFSVLIVYSTTSK